MKVIFLKVYLVDSNRQPKLNRNNLERYPETNLLREKDRERERERKR